MLSICLVYLDKQHHPIFLDCPHDILMKILKANSDIEMYGFRLDSYSGFILTIHLFTFFFCVCCMIYIVWYLTKQTGKNNISRLRQLQKTTALAFLAFITNLVYEFVSYDKLILSFPMFLQHRMSVMHCQNHSLSLCVLPPRWIHEIG